MQPGDKARCPAPQPCDMLMLRMPMSHTPMLPTPWAVGETTCQSALDQWFTIGAWPRKRIHSFSLFIVTVPFLL